MEYQFFLFFGYIPLLCATAALMPPLSSALSSSVLHYLYYVMGVIILFCHNISSSEVYKVTLHYFLYIFGALQGHSVCCVRILYMNICIFFLLSLPSFLFQHCKACSNCVCAGVCTRMCCPLPHTAVVTHTHWYT